MSFIGADYEQHDDSDEDEYIHAQLEAIANSEQQDRQKRDFEESQALAAAIGTSEQDMIDHKTQLEAITRRKEENDDEYRSAIQASAREFRVFQQSAALESHILSQKRQRTEERNCGSWDCPSCTYINPPYIPRCEACQDPSPSHVLAFCPFATIRFGLEIEVIIPGGKRDGYNLERIASELTRLGPPQVAFAGYSHDVTDHWKIVTDRSLTSGDEDLCFELVSPVLQGDSGLVSLRALLDNVRKLGITSNSTCGFHVHVDATKASNPQQKMASMGTLQGLQRVVQCFVALENAFDLIVARSWDRQDANNHRRSNANQYCRSNRLAFGSLSNRQRWERIDSAKHYTELVRWTNPNNDRYLKLNLTNIINRERPSTCEFRHHGGVEELLQAEAWVRLVIRFCEKASTASNYCVLLPEESRPRDELEALFRLIDCNGLTQYFSTEKRLYAASSSTTGVSSALRNEWECNVCQRIFQNSRALAQHSNMTGHS